jgi:hypothetical protein
VPRYIQILTNLRQLPWDGGSSFVLCEIDVGHVQFSYCANKILEHI